MPVVPSSLRISKEAQLLVGSNLFYNKVGKPILCVLGFAQYKN